MATFVANDDARILKQIVKRQNEYMARKSLSEKQKIYKIIYDYIVANKLIVYGGIALNHILPPKEKIYPKNHFSDYDCMIYNAKHHAKELVKELVKQGFKYSEVRGAVHTGTFKIFVNFEAVADITNVRQIFYDAMLALSEKQKMELKYLKNKDICIAPLYLLKHNIFKELARPKGSLYRWTKVFDRLRKLNIVMNKEYSSNIMKRQMVYEDENEVGDLFKRVLRFAKEKKLPLVGNFALGVLLGLNKGGMLECCKIDDFFSVFEIMAVDAIGVAEQLKALVKESPVGDKYVVLMSRRFFYPDLLPKRVRIYIKNKTTKKIIKFATIIDASKECYSVVKKNGYLIGSPYTVLQFFYAYWLIYYAYEGNRINRLVDVMINALESYASNISTGAEKFSVSCYGNGKTLIDVMKEKWNDKQRDYIYMPKTTNEKKLKAAL